MKDFSKNSEFLIMIRQDEDINFHPLYIVSSDGTVSDIDNTKFYCRVFRREATPVFRDISIARKLAILVRYMLIKHIIHLKNYNHA